MTERTIAKIYGPTESEFESNGLGAFQIIKAVEAKKAGLDGWALDADLTPEARVFAHPGCVIGIIGKPAKIAGITTSGLQFFRIVETKRTRGRLTVSARHILFDAADSVLTLSSDMSVTDTAGALIQTAIVHSSADRPALFQHVYDRTTSQTTYTLEMSAGTYTALDIMQATYEAIEGSVWLLCDGLDAYIIDADAASPETLIYGRDVVELKVTGSSEDSYSRIYPFDQHGLTIDPPGYIDATYDYGINKSAVVTIDIDDSITGDSARKLALAQAATDLVERASVPQKRYEISVADAALLEPGSPVYVWDPIVDDQYIDAEARTALTVTAYEYDIVKECMKSVTFGDLKSAVSRAQQGSVERAAEASGISGGSDSGGGYTLPIASSSQLGGVKIGSGITIAADGTISASGGGGWNPPNYVWIGNNPQRSYYTLIGETRTADDSGWVTNGLIIKRDTDGTFVRLFNNDNSEIQLQENKIKITLKKNSYLSTDKDAVIEMTRSSTTGTQIDIKAKTVKINGNTV